MVRPQTTSLQNSGCLVLNYKNVEHIIVYSGFISYINALPHFINYYE